MNWYNFYTATPDPELYLCWLSCCISMVSVWKFYGLGVAFIVPHFILVNTHLHWNYFWINSIFRCLWIDLGKKKKQYHLLISSVSYNISIVSCWRYVCSIFILKFNCLLSVSQCGEIQTRTCTNIYRLILMETKQLINLQN